ncbi:MAG: PQQ-like beta-propeller repeat protein [bacterium]|nr:PQQ-like beta-propeller repeat protein [bacterium]
MKQFSFLFLLGAGSVILTLGCGRQTPVNEITTEKSGISVQNAALPTEFAEAWPAWRGPTGDGLATDRVAPTQWSDEQGVAWMSDIPGRGHGSPIVFGDRVFLATAIDAEQQQRLLAYDRATGDLIWDQLIHEGNFPSSGESHRKGSNANVTLATDGSRIYAAFLNNRQIIATALDLDGKLVWQQELGAFASQFGYAPSPVLYKSFVLFAADNKGGGFLAALDAESGEIAWKKARAAKNSHSSPLVATVGGRDQLLICGCDEVSSYDPATGEQLWSTPGTATTTCGTMVATDERIFASGGYPQRQTLCLSSAGEVLWSERTKIYEPSMLALDRHLFAVSDDGIAYCWKAENGELAWRERLGGSFSASPVLAGENIYVSDLSGKTYVFRASADGYEQISINQLGTDCYASPCILPGEILLRVGFGSEPERQEKLVCIRGSEN